MRKENKRFSDLGNAAGKLKISGGGGSGDGGNESPPRGKSCAICGKPLESAEKVESIGGELVCKECFEDKFGGEEENFIDARSVGSIAVSSILSFVAIIFTVTFMGGYPGIATGAGIIFLIWEHAVHSEGIYGYIQSSFRTFGIIFLSLGLMGIFAARPILKLVPLLIAALGLMTFPSTAPVGMGENYRKGLAINKFVMGVALTGIFVLTFWSTLSAADPLLAISFTLLAAAFFITLPESTTVGSAYADSKKLAENYRERGASFYGDTVIGNLSQAKKKAKKLRDRYG